MRPIALNKKLFLLLGLGLFVTLQSACKQRRADVNSSEVLSDTVIGQQRFDLTTYTSGSHNSYGMTKELASLKLNYNQVLASAGTRYRNYGLTAEEAVGLWVYTTTSGYYRDINQELREQNAQDLFYKYKNLILAISSGINKLKGFSCDARRYVSLPTNVVNAMRYGQRHIELAFASSTIGKPVTWGSPKQVLNIKSKNCKSIENLSAASSEKEVLFPPGSEFVITSNWRNETVEGKNLLSINLEHVTTAANAAPAQAANEETTATTFRDFLNTHFTDPSGRTIDFLENRVVRMTIGGKYYTGTWEHDGNQHIAIKWNANSGYTVKIYNTQKVAVLTGGVGTSAAWVFTK